MKVEVNDDNAKKCICPNCPTHQNECMKDEIIYCGKGKSGCKIERQGCICGECPVASEYQLTDLYFCEIGEAK